MEADYGTKNTKKAYYEAYTYFEKIIKVYPEDIIFPLEADLFFHEKTKHQIDNEIEKTQKNKGVFSKFFCFFESPAMLIKNERKRRVFFKYGNGKTYHKSMKQNFSDKYLKSKQMREINIPLYHYEWIREKKYLEMRISQLTPGRGKSFRTTIIKLVSLIKQNKNNLQKISGVRFFNHELIFENKYELKANHPQIITKNKKFKEYGLK